MFLSTPSGPPAKRDILPVLGGGGGGPPSPSFGLGRALHVEVTQGESFRTQISFAYVEMDSYGF